MEKKSLLRGDVEKSFAAEKQKITGSISEGFPLISASKTEKCRQDDTPKKRRFFEIPKRYILCFLVFWGFLLMNCERSCLSVAIVAMSSKRKVKVDGKWVTKVIKPI